MAGKVGLADKLAGFSEHWAPRMIARYEGHEARLASAGTEQRPVARKGEIAALLLDPAESPNTGDHATAAVPVEA